MPSKEYTWFHENPEAVSKYAGEFIAIVGDSIVAHGKDAEEVFTAAKKHGDPLLHKVPPYDKELIV